ncbi:scarecrow-like protein 11 [Abrus precatorius]|uniref:Scarecrow-like protein 11 n=1 Tax=Abrus precatorius TaxID=3816 RepID=A0A8B8KRH8_ABRPR|nr:scarecrow-like protein 11 [Abrus precatorius]
MRCCYVKLEEVKLPFVLPTHHKLLIQEGGCNGKSIRSRLKKDSTNTGGTAVDLWTLLTQCAQAVAGYNQRNANDLLKQIRQHSSRFGDGLHRLAHYFAIGLETRLAAGTQLYMPFEVATAADMLKAYKLFVTPSPLQRMSNLFTTKTIISLVRNESSVHLVDFGICYGFQLPCLIRKLLERQGGPPRLQIIGIDLPQSGFRPAERVEPLRKPGGIWRTTARSSSLSGRLIQTSSSVVYSMAFYHFSSLFDMFDANVQREEPQREMLEKGLFGRNAINVLACEAERVERPYKQWRVRNLRARVKQVRLDPELMKREYHKNFVVAEDGKWDFQGWKGLILNVFYAWVPA